MSGLSLLFAKMSQRLTGFFSHDHNGDLEGESVTEAAADWDIDDMMATCGEYMSGQLSEYSFYGFVLEHCLT